MPIISFMLYPVLGTACLAIGCLSLRCRLSVVRVGGKLLVRKYSSTWGSPTPIHCRVARSESCLTSSSDGPGEVRSLRISLTNDNTGNLLRKFLGWQAQWDIISSQVLNPVIGVLDKASSRRSWRRPSDIRWGNWSAICICSWTRPGRSGCRRHRNAIGIPPVAHRRGWSCELPQRAVVRRMKMAVRPTADRTQPIQATREQSCARNRCQNTVGRGRQTRRERRRMEASVSDVGPGFNFCICNTVNTVETPQLSSNKNPL